MKQWVRLLALWQNADGRAIVFLVVLPLVYFFPVTLGQKIWYGDDIFLQWIPFGTELAVAIYDIRLPLWALGMLNGFPLLAEGQIGAFYPINLVLYRFLPVYLAVSYQNLLHIIWAECGVYALARAYGYQRPCAILASIIFSFSGFLVSHLIHIPFITALSWFPWLILLTTRFLRASPAATLSGRWFLCLTLVVALQILAGSLHVTLLSAICVIIWGFFTLLIFPNPQTSYYLDWQDLVRLVSAWLLGIGVSAIQLAPTFELMQYSERLSALDYSFRIVSSLPLAALVKLFFPFVHGMPDGPNNEFWNYVGILPLALAFIALLVQRNAWTVFLALLAVIGVSLAVGNANPLFPYISALPILNYFRAPARFMLFFVMAAALLSATALQFLSQRLEKRSTRQWMIGAVVFAILDLFTIGAVYDQSGDFWTEAWMYLPWGLSLATLVILTLAWTRRLERRMFQVVVISLTILDLACFSAPFFHSINPLASPTYILAEPRAFVALEKTHKPYRIFTDESGVPPFPTNRNALFPNVALIYRQESANGYTPLAYEGNHGYFLNLTPAMLNLLNARYVFVPLEPARPDGLVAPRREVRIDLTQRVTISPMLASGIEIVSFTQDADTMPAGTVVAQLVIETSDGQQETFPLRLGFETADWDYERKHVAYTKPTVAYTFPAFWRSFGRNFTGYAYEARWAFRQPAQVVGMWLEVLEPDVHLNIVAASLHNDQGHAVSVARLVGKNDFVIRFLSDTVAVWENLNFLPRAFIVHKAETFTRRLEFYRIQEPSFDPKRVVLLDNGPSLDNEGATPAHDHVEITRYQPESVRLVARTDRVGYLVLLDSWYPGWRAWVDGREVPVYRADFLFRAIPLEPGEHVIAFEFRPLTLYVGALVSAASLVVTSLVSLRLGWKTRKVAQ